MVECGLGSSGCVSGSVLWSCRDGNDLRGRGLNTSVMIAFYTLKPILLIIARARTHTHTHTHMYIYIYIIHILWHISCSATYFESSRTSDAFLYMSSINVTLKTCYYMSSAYWIYINKFIYQLIALIQIYMRLLKYVSAVTCSHLQGSFNIRRTRPGVLVSSNISF